VELIYFILVAYGLTQISVYAKIFDWIRPKHHFFHCPMCMGFWVGVFLLLINPGTELFNFEISVANFICLGSLSSGVSYILCGLFGDNGIKMEGR